MGVVFRRADLTHILGAKDLHHSGDSAQVIVNCTGLGARNLRGCYPSDPNRQEEDLSKPLGDPTVYPIRGQIVLVRNSPGIMADTPTRPDNEVTYVMEHAAGGGCVLGGSYQPNNWESQVDHNLANRIMARAIKVVPSLVDERAVKGVSGSSEGAGTVGGLSIIRHGVGLRPSRQGGVRIEKVRMGDVSVVHQYGHGGAGYQSSYGSAAKAVQLVRQAVSERASKARL